MRVAERDRCWRQLMMGDDTGIIQTKNEDTGLSITKNAQEL